MSDEAENILRKLSRMVTPDSGVNFKIITLVSEHKIALLHDKAIIISNYQSMYPVKISLRLPSVENLPNLIKYTLEFISVSQISHPKIEVLNDYDFFQKLDRLLEA